MSGGIAFGTSKYTGDLNVYKQSLTSI
jgi:hypothetical protein